MCIPSPLAHAHIHTRVPIYTHQLYNNKIAQLTKRKAKAT